MPLSVSCFAVLPQYLCHVFAVWMCQHCDCRWALVFQLLNLVFSAAKVVHFTQISCNKAFHWETNLINSLSNIAVLISLSSGMPNHSASIQVSLVLLFLCALIFRMLKIRRAIDTVVFLLAVAGCDTFPLWRYDATLLAYLFAAIL